MAEAKKTYRVGSIPGDGIGKEVVPEAKKVVDTAASRFGFNVEWTDYPFGVDHYLRTGDILPESALYEMGQQNAILLGAIGDPRVKPGVIERGILLTVRFHYDMFVNLRPARAYPGVPLPVTLPEGTRLDAVVVRENTEDFYVGLGGETGLQAGPINLAMQHGLYYMEGKLETTTKPAVPMAFQVGMASEPGVRRITAYACETARQRGEQMVTLASKSNALPQIYGFWERIAADEAEKQGMKLVNANVDALCYHLVRNPWKYGTILCPNMFGDIVSDLLAGVAGGLGVAAGGNIGDRLGMFEPVHGSAPDIAGTGKANPVAAILSAGLMLDYLGEPDAAKAVDAAVERYLATSDRKALPVEFQGEALCANVGDAIAAQL